MRVTLTPASSGITAVTGIPAPGVGNHLTLLGYTMWGATLGACYITHTSNVPADANILGSLYFGPGYESQVEEYITRRQAPSNQPIFIVAAGNSIYGFLEYTIDKDKLDS